jgi:hypothetical protein
LNHNNFVDPSYNEGEILSFTIYITRNKFNIKGNFQNFNKNKFFLEGGFIIGKK